MQKNTLLVAVGIALIIAVMWFLKSANDVKKNLVPIVQQVEIPAVDTAREPATIPTARQLSESPETIQKEKEYQALVEEYQTETQRLQQQTQTLATLRSRQTQQPSGTVDYSAQISSARAREQGLIESIQDSHYRENQLFQMADQQLQAQDSAAREARSQLDDRIRQQELSIRQTQNDIAAWSINQNYVNAQQAVLEQLSAQLADQQEQLANLQAQKADLSTLVILQARAIHRGTQSAQQDLDEERTTLQNDILSLREEIRLRQEAERQSRMNTASLASQISQTEKQIEQQTQRIQQLEKEMQDKQNELPNIQ